MGYFQFFLILKNPIKIKLRFLIKIKLRFSEGWMHPESTSILKNPIKIKLRFSESRMNPESTSILKNPIKIKLRFSEGRMRPESTSILKNPIKIKLNLDLLLREIIKRIWKNKHIENSKIEKIKYILTRHHEIVNPLKIF